jgi:hypothetical protein
LGNGHYVTANLEVDEESDFFKLILKEDKALYAAKV